MTSVKVPKQGVLSEVLRLIEGAPTPAGERLLARDVRTWIADAAQGIAATVEAVDGANATRIALARLAPSELTLAASVATERTHWAEVIRRGTGDSETGIVGLTLDSSGLIRRLVLLRAALVPAATGKPTSAPPGRPILESYFDDLMNSRFRDAAAHFSADALYSHPPYAGGEERILFTGREALWRGFEIERGPSPARQVITGAWQSGDRVFVEGIVEGISDGGTFFSTAQISSQGQIARYIAFYSAARIPA